MYIIAYIRKHSPTFSSFLDNSYEKDMRNLPYPFLCAKGKVRMQAKLYPRSEYLYKKTVKFQNIIINSILNKLKFKYFWCSFFLNV